MSLFDKLLSGETVHFIDIGEITTTLINDICCKKCYSCLKL